MFWWQIEVWNAETCFKEAWLIYFGIFSFLSIYFLIKLDVKCTPVLILKALQQKFFFQLLQTLFDAFATLKSETTTRGELHLP